jgi:hypothetical protein
VRPIIVVSGRHRPHEILLLAVSLVTGLAYTVGAPPPSSIAALLPGWAVLVWAVGLVISGALGLVALAARAPQVEQAAMLLGAAALVWYAAAAGQLGWRGAFAGVVCAAWAGANVARALQIRADLRGDR